MARTYRQANLFHRANRMVAGSRPGAWVYARTLHHIDRVVWALTRERTMFSAVVSGLPVVMLTTTGARSGRPRRLPLLGIPDGARLVVVASNFGRPHHPAWYHNLRAHPEALASIDGSTTQMTADPVEVTEERDRLWALATEYYPAWNAYRTRARGRRFPIFVLTPKERRSAAQPEPVLR